MSTVCQIPLQVLGTQWHAKETKSPPSQSWHFNERNQSKRCAKSTLTHTESGGE